MTHSTPLPSDRRIPSRRTIVRGIAWAAPTVTVVATAPAIAASPPAGEPSVIANDPPFTATQCDTVSSGTVRFTVRVGDAAAPAGASVHVTLPEGLQFSDGSRETTVQTGEGGLVAVPSFRAVGTAGEYAITATYEESVGYSIGTVSAQAGSIVQLTRQPGNALRNPTISTKSVNITNGVKGSISGDQYTGSTGANAAVITSAGTVRYWGRNVGATETAPGTLAHGGANVTGVRFIDTWTSVGNDSAGGVAAGSAASAVYQWYRTGTGTGSPAVVKVGGITGTVLQAESNDGYSYVLTSAGLHYWQNATSGTSVTATLLNGTAGASGFGSWSERTGSLTFGGGVVRANGTLAFWTDNHTFTTPPGAPQDVRTLVVTRSANYALTDRGELFTQGPAFSRSPGGTAWTSRATGVVTFAAWGVTQNSVHYTGGALVTAEGRVHAFGAISTRAWETAAKAVPGGTPASQVFASDGLYLALGTNGDVFVWAANIGDGTTNQPTRVSVTGKAADLEVWGYHQPAGDFYGGGYVITSPGACT